MRSPLPTLVAARLAERGLDARACLARFGLERALDDSHVVAEVETLAAFYDDAARRLSAPDLGLELVSSIDRGAYGLVEFGVRAAPTVREAVVRLARFAVLLNEATTIKVREGKDGLRVHHDIPGHSVAGGRHSNEYFLAVLVVGGRALTGGGLRLSEVWFSHAEPPRLEVHRRIFGAVRMRFDRPDNGIAIPAAVADLPLASADPALMRAIDVQADAMLDAHGPRSDFVRTVRRAIAASLREGRIGLSEVASRLAMTPRTLQRRLSDQGTSFRDAVDAVRCDLYARLAGQRVPMQEIAFRLGYTDMGSFRRAQRRWSAQ